MSDKARYYFFGLFGLYFFCRLTIIHRSTTINNSRICCVIMRAIAQVVDCVIQRR